MANDGEGTYKFTLGDELLKKAEDELSEKDKWRARDIGAVREKIKAHKGLYCPTDDAFILKFLRARKFDYDRAYDLLINYYTIRAKNKDVFDTLTPSAVKHVLDAGVSMVLPRPDKHGRRLIFFRPGKWIPGTFPIYDILKTNVLNIETILQEDESAQINGVHMIGEMSHVGIDHVKHFERKYGQLTAATLQDSFPLRFKGMHVVNEPAVFGVLFGIMKTFLKDKFIQRVHMHGSDFKKLHEHFDPSILPEELGGTLGKADDLAAEWKDHLLSKEQVFQDMLKYNIAVDRQIANAKSDEIVNCMVGTYKKLNID